MKNLWMVIAFGLIMSSINVQAKEVDTIKKSILGIWKFDIKEAPYEYQHGKITFFQADSLTKVKIDFENETIQGNKIKIENSLVSFEVAVQGEVVSVVLKLENDELIGKAVTSQGELPIAMKRKIE